MRLTIVVLAAFIALTSATTSAQDLAGRDYAYTMLLLSESEADIKFAARALYQVQSSKQEVLDLLAETLWIACSGKRKMDSDTVSWLAKTLGSTGGFRYAGVLDYCLSTVGDAKTIKYLKLARGSLNQDTVESFEGGKLNRSEMLTSITKSNNISREAVLSEKFGTIRKGQTLEDIYSAFGPPDEVIGTTIPGKKVGIPGVPGRIRIASDRLVTRYSELGSVRFANQDGHSDWKVVDVQSARGLFWSSEDGHFVIISDQIANGNGAQLREIAEHLMDRESLDRNVLDQIAGRIDHSRQDRSDQMVDGLAWLCKVLGKSGDGRYRDFLLDVANTAAHEKLKKYAARIGHDLPASNTDRYSAASK